MIPFLGADIMCVDAVSLLRLMEHEAKAIHSFLQPIITYHPNRTLIRAT